MPEKNSGGKKAVMVIAFRNFRDAEYFVPRQILEKAGVEVKTASKKFGLAMGAEGGDVTVDLLVKDIKPADFDALIFVGGPGCLESLDNEQSYRLAKDAVLSNKILAAICIAPLILANAGVLGGKRATVWSAPLDKKQIKFLEERGAIYMPRPVALDGKIVTADGPGAAAEFGEKIVELLTK